MNANNSSIAASDAEEYHDRKSLDSGAITVTGTAPAARHSATVSANARSGISARRMFRTMFEYSVRTHSTRARYFSGVISSSHGSQPDVSLRVRVRRPGPGGSRLGRP